jgi:hypothetical protein
LGPPTGESLRGIETLTWARYVTSWLSNPRGGYYERLLKLSAGALLSTAWGVLPKFLENILTSNAFHLMMLSLWRLLNWVRYRSLGGASLKNLNAGELLALLTAIENEQALWEERAYISFRLSKMCEARALDVEQSKEEIQALLTRLAEAEQVYGKRCKQ